MGTSECNVIPVSDPPLPAAALTTIPFVLTNVMTEINTPTQTMGVLPHAIEYCPLTNVAASQSPVDAVRVYPNPAHDQLYIQYNGPDPGNMRIRLCDATGKIIRAEQATGPAHIMDLTGLVPGMYFVLIEADDGAITQQRIIVH